mmetsp:Transcript_5039/g.6827  ORF Transcript_5039/g.6827 Transcript_5039/m.6827 type:complete len:220 (+) Transcript_5039:297-956(+)
MAHIWAKFCQCQLWRLCRSNSCRTFGKLFGGNYSNGRMEHRCICRRSYWKYIGRYLNPFDCAKNYEHRKFAFHILMTQIQASASFSPVLHVHFSEQALQSGSGTAPPSNLLACQASSADLCKTNLARSSAAVALLRFTKPSESTFKIVSSSCLTDWSSLSSGGSVTNRDCASDSPAFSKDSADFASLVASMNFLPSSAFCSIFLCTSHVFCSFLGLISL